MAGLLLIVAPLAASAADAPAGLARADVWRSVFARPADKAKTPASPTWKELELLGRDLFHDVRLSGPGDLACATCHDPARAFTDGRQRARSRDDNNPLRNTPSLLDVGEGKSFFWDGRAPTLEAQARVPLTAPEEMAGRFDVMSARLKKDAAVVAQFQSALPDNPEIGEPSIVAALAAYQRTLTSPRTRFDAWIDGDEATFDTREKAGFDLFVGKAGCVACHGGWRLTDDGFHDIGLPGDDPGRGALPGGVPGLAQFKTPGLRQSLHTAPYMHDGSMPTLRAVVDHYAGGLVKRRSLDANIIADLSLSEAEKEALVAFLATLSTATP